MLDLSNITKTFGSFKALDDLCMHVPKGAVYGLVGPNGAGKSTAIRCALGVYRPDSGTVTRGIYPNFDDTLFDRLYEVFQLPKNGQIRRFSKGMQKQAAFHLSICTRPDMLILDEPVDGLDPVMRRQVWSLILAEVAQRETTVLISSHNLRELEDICDHVGIMDHGKMLLQRSLADMQGSTVKLQIVGEVPYGLDILNESSSGRLQTLIVRGSAQEVTEKVAATHPAYFDVLPLSLEEIFIYELGGVNYEVKNIVL